MRIAAVDLPAEEQTLALLARLTVQESRARGLRELAARFGAEEALLFVRDPLANALLPAPGLPQTLRGGPAWRAFLTELAQGGSRRSAEVDLPVGTPKRPALALSHDRIALVVVGGSHEGDMLQFAQGLLPVLAPVLLAEQEALIAGAEASEARSAASRAQALAQALDTARADAARLNAQLSEADKRKDEFLAMLSHELRNPLAALASAGALLRLEGGLPERAAAQLEVMERQITQLSRLVDDLLDVARVSQGRIELRRERQPVMRSLELAIEASRAFVEARGHTVRLDCKDQPWVDGDSARLAQVFGNLIHNAAKYSDPGRVIRIEVEREGGEAVVHVCDEGIGIAPEMLGRIFDPFAQAPTSLSRSEGGLGIGLTLVRRLVELHGGRVLADSAGPGRGSVFTVRLTAVPAQAEPPAPTRAPRVHPGQSSIRIAVVDDNRDAADGVAALLRVGGHEVHVAYDGYDALRLAETCRPQVWYIDIGLPGIDGYELARRLRASSDVKPYLVALTGYGGGDVSRRATQAGFDHHLVKPADFSALHGVLASLGERPRELKA